MPLVGLAVTIGFGIALLLIFIKLNEINYFLTIPIVILALGGSYFLPPDMAMGFWLPGGTSSIILSIYISFSFLTHSKLVKEDCNVPLPDRQSLRAPLSQTQSIQDRQEFYIKIVRDLSRLYTSWETKVTPLNTRLILLAMLGVFAIHYTVFSLFFLKTQEFADIKRILILSVYNQQQVPDSEMKTGLEWIHNQFAIISFMLSGITYLAIYPLVRRFLLFRKKTLNPFGNIVFFRLPDIAIWIYIVFTAVFIYTLRFNITGNWVHISHNIFYIISLVYFTQAVSTLWLYLQIRILPGALIILTMFIAGMIFPLFLQLLFGVLLLFGVFEFWFSFRKKALHPKLISNDAL